MTPQETKDKIMESEEFVISEVVKMRTLYVLKKEIRYAHERVHESHTESVAEHVYAMHCLIDYFLPLENPEGDWDALKIHKMAQYHDIDEIETGDTIGYLKTESQQKNERIASEIVINNLPESLQLYTRDILDEYDAQETVESKFVKAIDKIEPLFHLYDEDGRSTMHKNMTTKSRSNSIKYPYIDGFKNIKRFAEVITDFYEREKYFYSES